MKLITILFILCATNLMLSAQADYIVFGKGGGFTGAVTAYKVFQDGKVQKGSGLIEIDYSCTGKIKKSKAKKIFTNLDAIEIKPFNHPGNLYFFISFFRDGNEIKYTWGSVDYEAPEAITTLYNEAVSQLSKLDFNSEKKK
jgi:hypothetical protein